MTEQDAFIRAICENPTDDTPRLIFADWLDERGDPRGEFIRVQCELARFAPEEIRYGDMVSQRYKLLRQREQELLNRPALLSSDRRRCLYRNLEWWRPETLRTWPGQRVTSHRGFVEEIACPIADFMRDAEAIFRATPILKVFLNDAIGMGDTPFQDDGYCVRLPHAIPIPRHEENMVGGVTEYERVWVTNPMSLDTARAFVSRQCVAYGRQLAGLPPLT